jgi:hypothetical protein
MKVLIEDTSEIREMDLPDQADWPVHYDVAGPGSAVYDVIWTLVTRSTKPSYGSGRLNEAS